MNYLNEWSPFHAEWCRNLAAAGEIPKCVVDETDIRQVKGGRLSEYNQCHFFAGIAGWPLALKLAGVPDDFPLWTGSCPCQPFSSAGSRKGFDDSRHLWPEMFRLIEQHRPPVVLGEQVASSDAKPWLDGVFNNLEDVGYACGAAVLPASLVGAPHIRHRLFWVAYSDTERCREAWGGVWIQQPGRGIANRDPVWLDDSISTGPQGFSWDGDRRGEPGWFSPVANGSASTAGFWGDFHTVYCRDGKYRRVGPGVSPLAHGIPRVLGRGKSELGRVASDARANRNGRIEGYGNAIVPELAALFVREFFGSIDDLAGAR